MRKTHVDKRGFGQSLQRDQFGKAVDEFDQLAVNVDVEFVFRRRSTRTRFELFRPWSHSFRFCNYLHMYNYFLILIFCSFNDSLLNSLFHYCT